MHSETDDLAPVSQLNPSPRLLSPGAALGVKLYFGASCAVILLMMTVGLIMRATQAGWLGLEPKLFYQLLTVHGAGMVGIAGLAGAGVMWFFLSRYVTLSVPILYVNFALFLLGVVSILASVFIGGYAGGWTFLWPLPAKSLGTWSPHAAAGFIIGLTLIGVGFLAFYFDAALAIRRRYRSLYRGLGLDQLVSGQIRSDHPPTVTAACMVIVVNTIGTLTGAVILVVTLVNLYFPALTINALFAKNLIYFFGHVFINASIYMSVMAVYELLPIYAQRPWKVSRPFFAAWACATLFVMAVYPHHLLMDGVMPHWMLVLGQVVSYLSGMPVLLVTAYGALVLVYRSGIVWSAPARWLMLSMFGWAGGVIPAIIDGTIQVNQVMHNTLWVPGHFHFYLLLGLLPMLIGFGFHCFDIKRGFSEAAERAAFWLYACASVVFSTAFLLGGWASVPRRFAQHRSAWLAYDRLATLAAVLIIAAMALVVVRLLSRLTAAARPAVHEDEA
jgi:cytochrome c oxidase subunit 1